MSAETAGGAAGFGRATRHGAQALLERGSALVGGPARARVVLLLAGALGLQGADVATLSATADNLQRVFGVGNTAIGLLVSVTALAGTLGTIPVGVLTDRTRRTRLLATSIGLWAVAMLFTGAATSFEWLLIARVGLGVVTATVGPTIASLTGDFFPARSRARMLGYILGGELVGTGIGFTVSGEIAALVGWRFAFWWLVIPTVALVWLTWRLPEPARDGHSRLQPGQTDIPDEREVGTFGSPSPETDSASEEADVSAGQVVRGKHVEPEPELVLTEDPTNRSLWWAVRYVLRVRANVVIIIASALGYFYFAGLQAFAIIFVTSQYGISKSVASVLTLVVGIGAVAGVYLGGRTADRLLGRGLINARVAVPAVALFGVVVVFAPAVATTSLGLALPLLTLGAGLLSAANPPLDAARLDIIHPALWGRAEGVRTVLRTLAQAASPLLFGWVSERVFGGGRQGLEYTFLVFLVVLIVAAVLSLSAMRSYPRDVATAAESYRRQPLTEAS
ncbi:MAG TPA: MFS transporter [Pseudonocardiaceae bacterium]|nr:MFS transporter [Pseudonocardiaceae bacterium]